MSLTAHVAVGGLEMKPSSLLIQDVQYQFLPNLAAIYGDTCAVILQQTHYTILQPYFQGERLVVKHHDGLDFVQMWPFMFYDTLEGIVKHLSRATWYRYIGALKTCKALRVEPSLGERNLHSSRRNEEAGPSWYALNQPLIQLHSNAYQRAFDEKLAERRAQRESIRRNDGSAHWRPAPGEDTSKPLDDWRLLFCEHWPKEAMPKPKKHGGKRRKLAQSQLEIGVVSEVVESQNTEIEDVKAFQSQVEIEPVSHHFQSQVEIIESQVETISQSQVETEEQSQVETLNNLKLRFTPYIDKTERSSRTESSDSTTTDTPVALSSAVADAVVENIHFLSGVTQNGNETHGTQLRLETILSTLLPEPTDAAAKLARRFQHVASEEHDIDCSDEIAARVVARFPIATLDEKRVKRLISTDRDEIGLNATIGGDDRRALLADVDSLRWQIFIWPGHRAEVERYYERKKQPARLTGAFLTKWREETPPPREWMVQLIDETKHALRSERNEIEQVRSDAAFATLDAAQRRALDNEIKERTRHMIGSVDSNEAKVRRQLLLDASFLASLASAPDPALETQKIVAQVANDDTAQVEAPLSAPDQNRCDLYVVKLRRRLRDGEIEQSDLKREMSHLGCTPAMEKYISSELTGVLKLEKAA
jgi:hypothetical protein